MEYKPDYVKVLLARQKMIMAMRADRRVVIGLMMFYKDNAVNFINDWVDTYDPRNSGREGKLTRMPLVLFPKQVECVEFFIEMIRSSQNGLIEKSRDMGATWVSCAFSIWLWLFHRGSAVGWGSRKEPLIDKLGDPDSIFEKMRMIISGLPKDFMPLGFKPKEHLTFMKIINPESGSTITGEAGDNIGRGGRKLIYFKDEAAHYDRAEKIEAALSETTNVQIDMSSVNGLGNVFHRKREAGIEWSRGDEGRAAINVFIMDWSDNPFKDQKWYDDRRKKAEANGLLHLFAKEVERNYSAAIVGTIIPADWVRSAIDAHKALGIRDCGVFSAALDVADGGSDVNAFAMKDGIILRDLQPWHERDTGVTARKVAGFCMNKGYVEVQYDCIGVGSGVKAEANRLIDDGSMPDDVYFMAWDAGSSPQRKSEPVIEGDDESPKNGDFYMNLKAQGWWELRRRFEKTHKAVTYFEDYPEDELISLPSELPNLRSLQKELSQPTMGRNSRLKMVIDKKPEGTRSPNLADAVMMLYHPIKSKDMHVSIMNKPSLLS